MFCPKCGSLLRPKVEGSKKILYCSCGYKSKDKKLEAKIKETVQSGKPSIGVITTDHEHTLPITKADCSQCRNTEAYYWLVQTRAGDEPETKFLRCTKCKHTWRDYD